MLPRGDAQLLFPRLLGKLLTYAAESAGIALKMGECHRTPEQAKWNAEHGLGIANSLHTERLAVDLLCFREIGGKWVWLKTGAEPEYRVLGNYWKGLHPDCAWGGEFGDPGHLSLRIDGRS